MAQGPSSGLRLRLAGNPLHRCGQTVYAAGVLPGLQIPVLICIIIKDLDLNTTVRRVAFVRRPQKNAAVSPRRYFEFHLQFKVAVCSGSRQPAAAIRRGGQNAVFKGIEGSGGDAVRIEGAHRTLDEPPARATFGVQLPVGALIEIDCIALIEN